MISRLQSKPASVKKPRFGFIAVVVTELKKVVWPTRQEALRLSIMVIIVCVGVGLILGIIDYGFTTLFNKVLLGGR